MKNVLQLSDLIFPVLLRLRSYQPDQGEPDLISFWDPLQIFLSDKESYSGFYGAGQVLSPIITLL